jgi:hypothetical protein
LDRIESGKPYGLMRHFAFSLPAGKDLPAAGNRCWLLGEELLRRAGNH